MSTFKREIHRPSAEKEWQHPARVVLPMVPGRPARSRPLEVHAASYLAASARISSFWLSSIPAPPKIERMYYYYRAVRENVKGNLRRICWKIGPGNQRGEGCVFRRPPRWGVAAHRSRVFLRPSQWQRRTAKQRPDTARRFLFLRLQIFCLHLVQLRLFIFTSL